MMVYKSLILKSNQIGKVDAFIISSVVARLLLYYYFYFFYFMISFRNKKTSNTLYFNIKARLFSREVPHLCYNCVLWSAFSGIWLDTCVAKKKINKKDERQRIINDNKITLMVRWKTGNCYLKVRKKWEKGENCSKNVHDGDVRRKRTF